MDWTIKQIAEMTGISADSLRYYEKQGIVSPKRSENGYRYFDETDIAILKYVVVMKYAHFSLAEIKSMTGLFGREPSVECNQISLGILNAKIAELKLAIGNYQKIVSLMEELLPMVCSIDSFRNNEQRIDGFVSQIYDDLQNHGLLSVGMIKDKKECE